MTVLLGVGRRHRRTIFLLITLASWLLLGESMGHQVTAVDIGQNFVGLISKRTHHKELQIDVRKGDFLLINRFEQ